MLGLQRHAALCNPSAFILSMGVMEKALGFLFLFVSGQAARPQKNPRNGSPPFDIFSPSPLMQKCRNPLGSPF